MFLLVGSHYLIGLFISFLSASITLECHRYSHILLDFSHTEGAYTNGDNTWAFIPKFLHSNAFSFKNRVHTPSKHNYSSPINACFNETDYSIN